MPGPGDLEDAVVLRNHSEPEAGKVLFDAFNAAINRLTVQESDSVGVEDHIRRLLVQLAVGVEFIRMLP